MSSIKKTLANYPDISFIENMTLDDLKNEMISDFCDKYKEITGEDIELGLADPSRLIMYAASLQIYQAMQYIDNAGKQSFIKYAYSSFLDNLGALKGIYRDAGHAAVATERFSVSAIQQNAINIPMGTRVTAGDNVFFYTTEDAEIPVGRQYVDVNIKCTDNGTKANGYDTGRINMLVNPIPYIGSVANITKTAGGTEEESDEQLADRIYLAPSGYSVAGPREAYEYWVKTCNTDISDVRVASSTPGVVEIRFIMPNGTLPDEAVIDEVRQYLMDENIRPLTDKVEVKAPETVGYNIDFKYYIDESNKNKVAAIRENVNAAVEAYKIWQSEKIARDINPSYLIGVIMNAGVKRVELTEPLYATISSECVAVCDNQTITYGGIEDD